MNNIRLGDVFQYGHRKFFINKLLNTCGWHPSCIELEMTLMSTELDSPSAVYYYCTHLLSHDLTKNSCHYVNRKIRLK